MLLSATVSLVVDAGYLTTCAWQIELLDSRQVRISGKTAGDALEPVQRLFEDPLNHTRIVVTET